MKTTIILDLLTENSVSVLTIITINYDNQEIEAKRIRKTYRNSIEGRNELLQEVGEPYYTSVLAIWGEEPTIIDPTPVIMPVE
jgi:hypothetical protein